MDILIVEDDSIQSQLIKRFLSSRFSNYTFYESKDGLEAIEVVNVIKIDLVLIDMSLPRMGGLECLRSLREMNIKIPFIVISGGLSETLVDSLYKLGAIDCLNKPFILEDLYNKVKRAK
jgi:CheY-like chemotaxis protein